jgi:UDP-N-acetylglucosamine pyrophosphorylase
MAGGQGTRLGHNGPKGTYEIGLESHKSIFELLCDTLKKASSNFEIKIPWYIMTSRENNKETVEFFEKNNYFNYGKENIKFFIQTELPMVDEEGKILLEEKWKIKKASDGHGGIFKSMYEKGIIDDMKNKGIKWIFINGVDNILANMVDDLLLGIAIDKNVLVAAKSIVKSYPEEKVGVFCKKNGKPSVVEYTEITKEMSEERDENGELKFGESHILSNLFNIEALIKMKENNFQYHVAHKKANYIKNGELIKPTEPNAYKFESFLFDAFELLDDIVIMRVKREDEFAPIKNAQGVDSPETAKKLYLNKHLSEGKVEK